MFSRRRENGDLHCGPDLHNAADRSTVKRSIGDSIANVQNSAGILADVIRNRFVTRELPQFELITATGVVPGASGKLTAVYAGRGTNRHWCLESTFSEYDVTAQLQPSSTRELVAGLQRIAPDTNIIFAESIRQHELNKLGVDLLRTPAWIKQRVRVLRDWPAQIDALRRGTRQEIARILRKYQYECCLTWDHADHGLFYDDLYRPHVSRRYGESAIVVPRDRFVRECRRGVVIQLLLGKRVVAAALLRPVAHTMAIVWSGMATAATGSDLRGATDALDYFSLLYAHLNRCRWLDFGPSRADLYDGTLQYKRKWGAEVSPGLTPQPQIHWACTGRHDDELAFLRQHAFLSRANARLRATAFIDAWPDTNRLPPSVAKLVTPGIDEYRIVALSPLSNRQKRELESIDANVSLYEASSSSDAMKAAAHSP